MKKMTLKSVLSLKIVLAGILILFCLFGFNFFKEYNRNRQLNNEIEKLTAAAKELEAKNLSILNLAEYLDTEEFLESEARTKFGMQKEGEKAIVVTMPDSGGDSNAATPAGGLLTNIAKWWEYFF